MPMWSATLMNYSKAPVFIVDINYKTNTQHCFGILLEALYLKIQLSTNVFVEIECCKKTERAFVFDRRKNGQHFNVN